MASRVLHALTLVILFCITFITQPHQTSGTPIPPSVVDHDHQMANDSPEITPNLAEMILMLQNQQDTQESQNRLLENTSATATASLTALKQLTTSLEGFPLLLTNMMQIQQDMQQQLMNITHLLKTQPRDCSGSLSSVQQNMSPTTTQATTSSPHATSLSSGCSGCHSGKQENMSPGTMKTTTPQPLDATSLSNNCLGCRSDVQETMPSARMKMTTLQVLDTSSLPHDCTNAVSSGEQTILPMYNELDSFAVYCDMDTAGGGWIVFQRRFDGSVSFDRNWADYENGFGDFGGEFWLGLSKLHVLTGQGQWELRVDIEDFNGDRAYAHYDNFQVGNRLSLYKLTIGSYSGTAGDSMRGHDINGMAFTTKDKDHDRWASRNCANFSRSGWWHNICTWANLNGMYLGPNGNGVHGMNWFKWKTSLEAIKKSEMKIRLQ